MQIELIKHSLFICSLLAAFMAQAFKLSSQDVNGILQLEFENGIVLLLEMRDFRKT